MKEMHVSSRSLHGSILEQNKMSGSTRPIVSIPGKYKTQKAALNLDEGILSKHLMFIGGTGCGKSNVFYHIVSQIKSKMSPHDVMIIFDTKGDYHNLFGDKDDLLIGNSCIYSSISSKWNVFKEIIADGADYQNIEANTQEISWSIFRKAIENSKDPFFPNAARDLFAAVLLSMLKIGIENADYRREFFYNSELKRAFDESTIFDIKTMIEEHPSLASVISYIDDGSSGQALGVYAELLNTIRQLFIGVFADKGFFSIRDFIKAKGGRTLFIEYDISIGSILAPIYSLMFDLALKESLGRSKKEGNVYFICDEFRLLPYLQHIEDGVNFGRSLGVKVLAGLQSINQLTEVYGDYRGKNIIAGFSTVIAFRANDVFTRNYISNLHGKNLVLEQYKTITNTIQEDKRIANVVEDWDMKALEIGEAIVSLPFDNPFKFKFDLYRKESI